LSRQTTLFGRPSKPPAENKGRPLKKGEEPETGASDIDGSTSVSQVPDVDMSEVPPPSEAVTLVETQEVEGAATTTEDTQPIEDEVLIEWEASPPPPSPR